MRGDPIEEEIEERDISEEEYRKAVEMIEERVKEDEERKEGDRRRERIVLLGDRKKYGEVVRV